MTIIASEIERFNRLGATWWNSDGPMRPLHVIDELRLANLRQLMAQQFTCVAPSKLAGLRVLDIGCGLRKRTRRPSARLSTRCHQDRRDDISGLCDRAQLRQLPTLPGQPGVALGACGAMGGKLVNAKGWCVAWVRKA
jgi:hypothetical protein